MEENEYVRTDLGEIAIVTSVAKETLQDIMGNLERIGINEEIGFCNTEPYVKGNIIKHSKNIVDLIEIGDILKINNKKYEVIFDKSIEQLGLLIPNEHQLEIRHCTLEYVFSKNGFEEFKNIEILTKEQYEVNCYKLGR